jgi:hypothetical protein
VEQRRLKRVTAIEREGRCRCLENSEESWTDDDGEGGDRGCADWQDLSYTVASIIDNLPIGESTREEKVNLLGVRIS